MIRPNFHQFGGGGAPADQLQPIFPPEAETFSAQLEPFAPTERKRWHLREFVTIAAHRGARFLYIDKARVSVPTLPSSLRAVDLPGLGLGLWASTLERVSMGGR